MRPARALRIGVTELLRHPGSRFEVRREVPASELGDLVVGTSRVEPDVEICADLVLESQTGTVVASGTVSTVWSGECRRCLEPVTGDVRHELREVFGEVAEGGPDADDLYPLDVDQLDLEPLLRDAVLLSLPVAPLCGPDCRGPVPEAFEGGEGQMVDARDPAGADDDPTTGSRPRDPRWAALDALDFDQ